MARKRPHLLIFNPDQWRGDVLGHRGDPAVRTPVLDRLVAEEAVSFTETHCQNPVCTPSRCSFMSGWYPQTRGHRTMFHMLHHEAGEENLLRTLKKGGYRVWWAGKNDLVPGDEDFGLHCHHHITPDDADYAGWGVTRRPDNHQQQALRGDPGGDGFFSFYIGRLDKGEEPFFADTDWGYLLPTLDFIRRYDGEEPLCLYLPLQYPHPPYGVEEPWFSLTDRAAVPARIPEPADLSNRPRILDGILQNQKLRDWTEDRWRELRATYYGMCARVDHQFGMVLQALRERGFLDDTAVLFFSDHGDFTGDFGIAEKAQNLFYDPLTRVPLVIRPPRDHPVQPGIRTGLVELLDVYATILEFAGLEAPHRHFSRSLLPQVAGETGGYRDAVVCQGGRRPGEAEASESQSPASQDPLAWYYPRNCLQLKEDPFYHNKGTMLRTREFKYIQRLGEADELYDLQADPREERNVIGESAYSGVLQSLRNRLLEWYMETGDIVPLKTDSR